MDAALIDAFNLSRDFTDKAVHSLCYAPHTSLYFDTRGNVRACCYNFNFPAGNISEADIDTIWHGAKLQMLRDALQDDRFGPGCEFCENRLATGVLDNLSFRNYDAFSLSGALPKWPQQMEFSISNACNLECIMCRGQWSSAIRKRREKLPPLPLFYKSDFIESLRKYLPHLKRIKFLGGEPFLIRQYFQLWEMMIAENQPVASHVTTNGTQYNRRIARVMEHIPVGFAVSLDGATKATVEAIRVNANFAEQMRNVARFRSYARERRTAFSLTFCLMRQNWHEFGEFCLLADSLDCPVGINTVLDPPEFGVYTLPVTELSIIVRQMECQASSLEAQLGRNRGVWFGELERMRRHLV